MSKEEKEKIDKVITELSSDVQKPIENNFKEDNAINEVEDKGDVEIDRE